MHYSEVPKAANSYNPSNLGQPIKCDHYRVHDTSIPNHVRISYKSWGYRPWPKQQIATTYGYATVLHRHNPETRGPTTSKFKPAIKPVEEGTQVLATCTETGTEGARTYTIWHGSIQGVSTAAAKASVDADTTSALDLIRATESSETLQERH